MALTDRERLVAAIAGGIAAYSIRAERGELPEGATVFDFILGGAPADLRPGISMDLVDEVFGCVSGAHSLKTGGEESG